MVYGGRFLIREIVDRTESRNFRFMRQCYLFWVTLGLVVVIFSFFSFHFIVVLHIIRFRFIFL